MKISGHKCTISHNSTAENPYTATCICGWSESHAKKRGAEEEYHWHLQRVRENPALMEASRKRAAAQEFLDNTDTPERHAAWLNKLASDVLASVESLHKFYRAGKVDADTAACEIRDEIKRDPVASELPDHDKVRVAALAMYLLITDLHHGLSSR